MAYDPKDPKLEEKIRRHEMIFAVAPPKEKGDPDTVILGITTEAWNYMKDGMTHTFDLRKVGIPVQMIIYGSEDYPTAMAHIKQFIDKSGIPFIDARGKVDFGIDGNKK